MTVLQYGETAGREVSARVAAPVASNAALAGVGPLLRAHGQICVTLDAFKLWVFDGNDSTTAAGATVIVPTTGAGRWKLLAVIS